MSDRIVVMYNGRAEQFGTPVAIYNKPATRFVAGFVGTLNLIEAKVAPGGGKLEIDGQPVIAREGINGAAAGTSVTVALRPEAITLAAGGEGRNALAGTVEEVSFLGSVIRVRVALGDDVVSLDTFNNPATPPPVAGEKASISFSPEDVHLLDA